MLGDDALIKRARLFTITAALVGEADHIFGFDELAALGLERLLEDISSVGARLAAPAILFVALEGLDAGLPVVMRGHGDDDAAHGRDRFAAHGRGDLFGSARPARPTAASSGGEQRANHHR